MKKEDLIEMRKADCLFNIDDPTTIYSTVFDIKAVNKHQDYDNICLLWISEGYDPEEYIE